MSDLDDFLCPTDKAPALEPLGKLVARFRAIVDRMAEVPEDQEPTFACHSCMGMGYISKSGSAWFCLRCELGKAMMVYYWLNKCFPHDSIFGKRVASRVGQEEFAEYCRAFPEQEYGLRQAIDRRRHDDQRPKEQGPPARFRYGGDE